MIVERVGGGGGVAAQLENSSCSIILEKIALSNQSLFHEYNGTN